MEKQWSDEEFEAEKLRRHVKQAKDSLAQMDAGGAAMFMGVGMEHFTSEELQKIVVLAIKRSDSLYSTAPTPCVHSFVDARNEVVTSGEVCTKCGEIRS